MVIVFPAAIQRAMLLQLMGLKLLMSFSFSVFIHMRFKVKKKLSSSILLFIFNSWSKKIHLIILAHLFE